MAISYHWSPLSQRWLMTKLGRIYPSRHGGGSSLGNLDASAITAWLLALTTFGYIIAFGATKAPLAGFS